MLMSISEYRATNFTEKSAPDARTIKKWIDNYELPGKIIGGKYFVEIEAASGIEPASHRVLKVLNQEA